MNSYILGFSGIAGLRSIGEGHNPAVVLLKDGRFVAGAAEERFNRIKNSPGEFPRRAITFVLESEGIGIDSLDSIAWSNDPHIGLRRWREREGRSITRQVIGRFAELLDEHPSSLGNFIDSRFKPSDAIEYQRAQFVRYFGSAALGVPFTCVDHHLSHAASAYYPSGFDEATVITWDGSGDGLSGSVRHGVDGVMHPIDEYSDFSIGEMYWAIHSYLGLSDEGSLMGLAAYGSANGVLDPYADPKRLWMDLARIKGYHQPVVRRIGYSPEVMHLLAPPRGANDELLSSHRDLAAELQEKVEAFCFEIVRRAIDRTGCKRIALAGGVALNAVFNGKLGRARELCDELFVQPNPGDEGGALGAAYIEARRLGQTVDAGMQHAYWGPKWGQHEIESVLNASGVPYAFLDDDRLVGYVGRRLSEGAVVGWFQGRVEWGPRALGNRSILADPRSASTAERVNLAVKYRDPWRPFAPSMLAEVADAYLEDSFFSPFMITTFTVKESKRSEIPSVVHADGTTRPQMVTREMNHRYYDLIREFGRITGTPVLLNTSFNLKGEPIVASPSDALRTFFGSGIDLLVLENYFVDKVGLITSRDVQ